MERGRDDRKKFQVQEDYFGRYPVRMDNSFNQSKHNSTTSSQVLILSNSVYTMVNEFNNRLRILLRPYIKYFLKLATLQLCENIFLRIFQNIPGSLQARMFHVVGS